MMDRLTIDAAEAAVHPGFPENRRRADRRARRTGGRGRRAVRDRRSGLPARGRGDASKSRATRRRASGSGRGARRRSRRWAASRRTTTCRTASCRARGFRRCCAGFASSKRDRVCGSATCSTPATATCTRSSATTSRFRDRPNTPSRSPSEILSYCIEAGGAITGEHGVGADKKAYMPKMFTPDDLDDDAAAALRVRSVGPLQSGQGVPDAAAVRRSSGAVPPASARAGRPRRAVLMPTHRTVVAGAAGCRQRSRPLLAQADRDRARRAVASAAGGTKCRRGGAGAAERAADRCRTTALAPSDRTLRRRSDGDASGAAHDAGRGQRGAGRGRASGCRSIRRRPTAPRSAASSPPTTAARGATSTARRAISSSASRWCCADGRIAKAGGRVVKNVAGYDLARLLCGSFGTLAVITSATFKLAPLAAGLADRGRDGSQRRAPAPTWRSRSPRRRLRLPPSSSTRRRIALLIRFETTARAADAQADAAAIVVRGRRAPRRRRRCRRRRTRRCGASTTGASVGGPRLEGVVLPTEVERPARADVARPCSSRPARRSRPDAPRWACSTRLRGRRARPRRPTGSTGCAALAGRARRLGRRGDRPPLTLESRIDAWGELPGSRSLMRAVKARFDPQRHPQSGRRARTVCHESATVRRRWRPLEPLMDKCVHCGFCLPTCPSYLLLGQEMDSPRGRIYLMRAGVEERVAMTRSRSSSTSTRASAAWRAKPPVRPACATRRSSSRRAPPSSSTTTRPLADRLFRAAAVRGPAVSRRGCGCSRCRCAGVRLRSAAWPGLLALLPPRLRQSDGARARRAVATRRRCRASHRPRGAQRLRVGLVTGCVQRVFFGDVNEATVRVLAAEGCDVLAPAGQGCCGALALHAGRDDEARAFARAADRGVRAVRIVDAIVVNAAGCGSTMKEYGELLRGRPAWAERAQRVCRARCATSPRRSPGSTAARRRGSRCTLRVAYHDACHLAHAQGVRARAARAARSRFPASRSCRSPKPEICCGSAGIFNLVAAGDGRRARPPQGRAHRGRRRRTSSSRRTRAASCRSAPRCASRRTHRRRSMHIVELLDASISKASEPG